MKTRQQLNWLQKLWIDTTTNPATGKYSQKRLMMWIAFFTAILLCLVSVFKITTDPEFDFSTDKPDLGIIIVLFTVAGFTTLATLAGSFISRKLFDENRMPMQPDDEQEKPLNETENG